MAKHRTHSIEFKRQVAQEFLAGETLYGLAKRPQIGGADSRESPRVRESPAWVSLCAVPSLSYGRPRLAPRSPIFADGRIS